MATYSFQDPFAAANAKWGKEAANSNIPTEFFNSFNYAVEFTGKRRVAKAGFSSVSGIKASMQVSQIPEGGVNDMPHNIPKGLVYQPVILERGVSADGDLMNIFAGQFKEDGTGVSVAADNLAIVKIKHKDRSGKIVRTYELRGVLITGYEISDLIATQSAILMERVILTFNEVSIS